MRFGMFDQTEQPGGVEPGELLESRLRLAERAEQAGFWGYHKSEHHLTPLDHGPSIGLFLAALAQRTSTMRLCSLVHILPFYHPLRLLEEVCMLDHLSGGRLEVGFGKGISPPEHSMWGLDPDEAAARTDEVLAILLAAMQSDGSFSFEGEFFSFDDVPLEVKPKQRPYPPLWRPGTLDTAAKLGVSTVVGGPTAFAHQAIERYHVARQEGIGAGHKPTVGVVRKFIVAPTDREADELGRRAWVRYTHNLGLLFRAHGIAIPNDPTIGGDYERAKQVHAIVVGSPATVRDHVNELASSPLVEYLIGCFAFGDLTHDEALRSLDLFGEHVVADAA
ncbi:MAG: LLM class flavin-dependent oxidoreductase [Actinomycetota bacterium]